MDKGLRKFLPVEVGISTSEAHEINIKPVAASSPSRCKISMLELGKPWEGMRDVRESNIQFAHVSSNILLENH